MFLVRLRLAVAVGLTLFTAAGGALADPVPGGIPVAPASVAGAQASGASGGPSLDVASAAWAACEACKAGKCDGAAQACSAQALAACVEVQKLPKRSECADPTSACYASYFERRAVKLVDIVDACPSNATNLEKALNRAQEKAGATVLLAAVGGLQSFLAERAKAEAIGYTVDQLKGRLCEDNEGEKYKYADYLKQTCTLLAADDLDLDEATLVRLKQALLEDLNQLPATFAAKLPVTSDQNQLALRVFATSGAETVFGFAQGNVGLSEIPARWADADTAGYSEQKLTLTCSMVAPTEAGLQRMPAACWALLLPEIGRAAVDKRPAPTPEGIASVIEAAAQTFCATYGPATRQQKGSCLLPNGAEVSALSTGISKASAAADLAAVKKLVMASLRFAELAKLASTMAAQGTPSSEIVTRLLPDLTVAFNAWNAALKDVLPGMPAVDEKILAGLSFAFRASAAVASRDYPALLGHLAQAFDKGGVLEAAKLPKSVMRSLGFAARLASAQTSEDAKKVFEEEAAPLGSYKVKYDREKVTIAVNAFVGPFFSAGRQYQVQGDDPDTDFGLVVRPISAPIGVDFTLASGKCAHFGLIATIVDPFAVGTIDADAEAEDFDWGALLTPGVQARLGIGGSPFTLMAGVTWQPLARSPDTCVSGTSEVPCWKGALQVGGGMAIDVPLLILR